MKLPACCDQRGDHLLLRVRVVPRAANTRIEGLHGDALKIRLQSPPVDGKANKALLRFLSDHLGVPRNQIELLRGERNRNKVLLLPARAMESLRASLG